MNWVLLSPNAINIWIGGFCKAHIFSFLYILSATNPLAGAFVWQNLDWGKKKDTRPEPHCPTVPEAVSTRGGQRYCCSSGKPHWVQRASPRFSGVLPVLLLPVLRREQVLGDVATPGRVWPSTSSLSLLERQIKLGKVLEKGWETWQCAWTGTRNVFPIHYDDFFLAGSFLTSKRHILYCMVLLLPWPGLCLFLFRWDVPEENKCLLSLQISSTEFYRVSAGNSATGDVNTKCVRKDNRKGSSWGFI